MSGIGGTPIWADRGPSDTSATYTVRGVEHAFPKHWTRRWVEALTEEHFLAASEALRAEDDYWSAFNLRTLENRILLFYRERERRYG